MAINKSRTIGEYTPSEDEIQAAGDAYGEIYIDTEGAFEQAIKGALISAEKARMSE